MSRVAGGEAERRFQQAITEVRASLADPETVGTTGKITVTFVVESLGETTYKVGVGDVKIAKPAMKVQSRMAFYDDEDLVCDDSELDPGEQARIPFQFREST